MNSFCRHAGSVKEGIAKILSNIIAKEIQLQYSACGRSLKGQGKRNLSKTAVYYCMQGTNKNAIKLKKTFEHFLKLLMKVKKQKILI